MRMHTTALNALSTPAGTPAISVLLLKHDPRRRTAANTCSSSSSSSSSSLVCTYPTAAYQQASGRRGKARQGATVGGPVHKVERPAGDDKRSAHTAGLAETCWEDKTGHLKTLRSQTEDDKCLLILPHCPHCMWQCKRARTRVDGLEVARPVHKLEGPAGDHNDEVELVVGAAAQIAVGAPAEAKRKAPGRHLCTAHQPKNTQLHMELTEQLRAC